ncbi:acyl-CoA thioesterase [Ichthyenterobacterium magnum]|uniref:Acyl-CoA thioester hydrolase n=1 Tax=Ichthyenterobacterium magnum TaxID=1230530 RepID=A0A420DLN3_9FLAO|nr:acyl-CoA thioesterase [Ichthyenterobacterium magnum]RKE95111.1 acyl-CoA thioester hydrolase [Ichthyenterobacterium magnum]
MNTLPKTLESQSKIRFQDCDPFNHLNNGNYIDYFMNHREDQLIKHYAIDVYAMAQKLGKSWVSSSNQIAYIKPALLMETVSIESQLIHYDSSNLKVEMRMYNKDKSQLKAVIWCGFVHFNLLKQQREAHSENLMTLFKGVKIEIKEQLFEERINNIRKMKANSSTIVKS